MNLSEFQKTSETFQEKVVLFRLLILLLIKFWFYFKTQNVEDNASGQRGEPGQPPWKIHETGQQASELDHVLATDCKTAE